MIAVKEEKVRKVRELIRERKREERVFKPQIFRSSAAYVSVICYRNGIAGVFYC